MSSIDERVVEMKFNGGQFLSGIKNAITSLDGLKKGLNLDGSRKSLEGLNTAGRNFSLAGMATGIEHISSKFNALTVVGVTALATIANKAVTAGTQLVNSLTMEPVMAGFKEYELKMGSIQTILSNTSKDGTTLKQVTATLDDLNTYADKTIYNFGDMTRNIGLFTNAGIGIKDSADMIKGFSNEAAASGTNAQGAAGAAYQLSQALSSGVVTLMDWKSLSNVGMGNKNMQSGIIEIADAMGTFEGKSVTAEDATKSFNTTLEKKWLTADVMQNYLKIQAGELSEAQMKNIGLEEKQIDAFMKQQKIAEEAATKVRTWTQLVGTMQEGVGSGWSETFDLLIGDFDQATKLWTNVNDTLGPMIGKAAEARNKMIGDWAKLGGRDAAISAISNAFSALMGIMKPIGTAFREIFPAATGKQVFEITKGIQNFTKSLIPSKDTAEKIGRTFKGVFAVLDIGRMILVQAAKMFVDLFFSATDGAGGILDFTANIGDFLVSVRDAIKNGKGLSMFFGKLGLLIRVPFEILKALGGALVDIFSSFGKSGDAVGSVAERIQNRFAPVKALGGVLLKVWGGLAGFFQRVGEVLKPIGEGIVTLVSGIGKAFGDAMTGMDFSMVLDTINTGLLAAIVLLLKNFLGGGFVDQIKEAIFGGGGDDDGGGFLDTIKESFGGLTDTMKAMQSQLKADALLKLGGAIALLAGSVAILAMVDGKRLATSLTGLTVMMGQLMGAMYLMDVLSSSTGFIKMPFIAAGLAIFAGALILLSIAVKSMSGLDWEGLTKGLVGVTVLMGGMAVAARIMSANKGGLISAGIGMIGIAIAIKILASAVRDFSSLSWEEMSKGLVGVGAVLLGLAIFSRLSAAGKGAAGQAVGIIILAAAMKIFASAVKDFADMDWPTLARGMAGLAGALIIVAGAMRIMPKNMLFTATSLVILGAALKIIASAVLTMAGMTWDEIGRGMTVLAGSLAILAVALFAMSGSLLGSAALIVAAGALAILAPVLVTLGGMLWDEIGRGLVMLGGTLLILAVGLTAMSGALLGAAALVVAAGALNLLAPVLVLLGGMSWAQIGAGLTMLAGALAILGIAGVLLLPAIPGLMGLGVAMALLGVGAIGVGVGLMAFATGLTLLAAGGAAAAAAIVQIVKSILQLLPFAFRQLGQGLIEFANVIARSGPALMGAITAVLLSIIGAINRVAPQIVATLVRLVFLMVNALVTNVPKLVVAGMQLLLGILKGIANNIGKIVTVAADIIVNFINGIAKNLPRIVESGANLIITFVESLASTIRNNTSRMNTAGRNLAGAIIEGMVSGIGGGIASVASAAREMAGKALAAAKDFLNINSPSKKFIEVGSSTSEGFVKGIVTTTGAVVRAAAGMGQAAIDGTRKALDINSPSKEFEKLGKYSKDGFVKGLTGTKKESEAAWKEMRDLLSSTAKAAAEDVKKAESALSKLRGSRAEDLRSLAKAEKEKAKLQKEGKSVAAVTERIRKLTKSRVADEKAIKAQTKTLNTARSEYKRSVATYKNMGKYLKDDAKAVEKLAGKYDYLAVKLKDANKQLDDAKKTRDDYKSSIRSQYSDIEDINENTRVKSYFKNLEQQIKETQEFATKIQELRKLGLNDTLYKELLAKGPDAMPFIKELIAGGKAKVTEFNGLQSQLDKESYRLSKTTSENLYQAGVDAAAGLVKGLEAQQKNIEKQMDKIALYMVKIIKRNLGIKSPSRVFAKIGVHTTDGLIKGLRDTTGAVGKATEAVGDTAVKALGKTMGNIGNLVSADMDVNPTIRPVLDLTSVKKDAGMIDGMLSNKSLSLEGSYSKAVSLAAIARASQEDATTNQNGSGSGSVGGVTLIQNNNSPKALSRAEIYRQTKNQISAAKGVLVPQNA